MADGRREASVGTRNAAKRVAVTAGPPWKSWRKSSRHGRAIRFIETYCRPPKGKGFGQRIKLATFQKEFLEQVLADGIDASVLTTPRGNGKSTFGGALAVWAAFDDDSTGAPQVPVIATKISQAIRSCYGVAAYMVRKEPELANRSITYTGFAQPRIVVPFNEGELFPTANDPEGLQGLDYSLALFDEIGFQPMESWDSLGMAAGKRERSLVVGLGTRGLDRSNALENLSTTLADGGDLPGFVFHEYGATTDLPYRDPETWRVANPAIGAGFLRESALTNEVRRVPEGHFRIFRLNQRWDGVDSWLGADGRRIWVDLKESYGFKLGAATWVGVDVGLKRDSTAVVAVQQDERGHYHAKAEFWVPNSNDAVDVTDVMKYIRDLAKDYSLRAVSFDPRFFDVPAKMLHDEGLPMTEIPQSVERMTTVVGSLLEVIRRSQIHYDPQDRDAETLATHVLNAVPRFNERGFTLQKSKARGRIDGCIALALAVDRALRVPAQKRRAVVAGF